MDDRNFDEETAQQWIDSVEKPGRSWRDEHVYSKLSNLIREASPRTVIGIIDMQLFSCKVAADDRSYL